MHASGQQRCAAIEHPNSKSARVSGTRSQFAHAASALADTIFTSMQEEWMTREQERSEDFQSLTFRHTH
jgi:hypothetical protein